MAGTHIFDSVIDTEDKLAKLVPQLRVAAWIAVDTEADSLHAYPEKVCLIQITTLAGDALIDPLADLDLTPLLDALAGHELIMHGADYDLRLLVKHHRFVPAAVFDTMLAARLLGERQFSYSNLVEKFVGVKLEKGPQKANWAMRPLTARMESYARNDTRYLRPLEERLRTELQQKGRLEWHQEACRSLVAECSQPRPHDNDSVWRIKGSRALGRPALAVLRELWKWREAEAVSANRPPYFILSHEALVDVAAAAATRRPIDSFLPRSMSERRRAGIADAIGVALNLPADKFPRIPEQANHRPNEAERRRYLELQRRRDAKAHDLGIDATLIASRAMLGDLARSWEKHSGELMDWQRALLKP
jgi:ribonuclease D